MALVLKYFDNIGPRNFKGTGDLVFTIKLPIHRAIPSQYKHIVRHQPCLNYCYFGGSLSNA